ncbi:pentatricopeptide repeat-containing protein At3g62890-like [Cucurbita pepo subsp. pepo]|uniref:pentatricopeptide repeat-containing protein At3g62890-like n=1 Tax=Cucurbita pepo subsp. pepo TaxID=3664 RepID=UPI000C9D732C|nr:pentatricopeptide repeat-containing protein At3g62890-like [Cucurbita pepo subsp. pepo]
MRQLFEIQAQLLASPIPSIDPNIIAVKFIGVSSSHGNLRHSVLVFNHYLTSPNIFAYNALLKAFAQHNAWHNTIAYFNNQLVVPDAPNPDEYTFTSVLKACAGLAQVLEGQKVHCFVTKYGCESNLFVRNSLVDLYFKVGCNWIAQKLFDEMSVRDVVSWNTLISGYCLSGMVDKARMVFDGMMEKNLVSWSTMISGYARMGNLEEARHLFENMPMRNVVSWNAMIAGYAQNEKYADAIELFRQMQREGDPAPNDVTLVSVLSACAHLGALDLGKWIHKFIRRSKMEVGLFLGNALADMYAKCGCILEAKRVFHEMQERDVTSWSIIIMGLAMYGYADEAFNCFAKMIEDDGLKPNDISFMGLLTACTHAGLVDKGLEYFDMMAEVYGITPKVEHYGCVVDLLSRAGRLDQAESLINSMPMQPNVIVWGALLGGCRIYKDAERGECTVRHILELDSNHSGSLVYLANIYASMGRLDDAANCRLKMRDNKSMKTPGCSWIEIDNSVYEFFMGDLSHPQSAKIYSMIRELKWKMKLAGYKPKTDLVIHNIDEEEKEDALSTHSEKLALAFGLINTSEGTTIRIVKNLRVCDDCHDAMKIISEIVEREIVVRDRSRFHHFNNGKCSCNDYW